MSEPDKHPAGDASEIGGLFEVTQESALSMAQSVIWNAMTDAGFSASDLARRMGKHRSYVSRMLTSRHNMTIKTFALALAACDARPILASCPCGLHETWQRNAKAF